MRQGRWYIQARSLLCQSHSPNILAKGNIHSGGHMRGEKCVPNHLTFLSPGQAELEADLCSPPTFCSGVIPIRAVKCPGDSLTPHMGTTNAKNRGSDPGSLSKPPSGHPSLRSFVERGHAIGRYLTYFLPRVLGGQNKVAAWKAG